MEHVINKHLEYPILFVGIRHNKFNHDKDKDFIFSDVNHMQSELWLENFKLLEKYNLSFDLGCFYNQLVDELMLQKNNPNISIILNHVGQPIKER